MSREISLGQSQSTARVTHIEAFIAGGERAFDCVGGLAQSGEEAFIIDYNGSRTRISLAQYERIASRMLELGRGIQVDPGHALIMIGSEMIALLKAIGATLPAGAEPLIDQIDSARTDYGAVFLSGGPGQLGAYRGIIEQHCLELFDADAKARTRSRVGLTTLWRILEVAVTLDRADIYTRGTWLHEEVLGDIRTAERLRWEALQLGLFKTPVDLEFSVVDFNTAVTTTSAVSFPGAHSSIGRDEFNALRERVNNLYGEDMQAHEEVKRQHQIFNQRRLQHWPQQKIEEFSLMKTEPIDIGKILEILPNER